MFSEKRALMRRDLRMKGIPSILQRGIHTHTGKNHLRLRVDDTRHAGRLTQQIEPADDPRPDGGVFGRHYVLGDKVHPPRGWIGGNQFGHCSRLLAHGLGLLLSGRWPKGQHARSPERHRSQDFKEESVGGGGQEKRHPPDLAIHEAMMLPTNQAQTAAAGPPRERGLPKVAGTEPRTPRTEMA